MLFGRKSWFTWAVVCISLFVTTILLSFQSVFAESITERNGTRTVRIGITDGDDEQNKAFQMAYFKALAQYARWKCEFVNQTWDENLNGLKSGEIDLLSDVSITEERSSYMDFAAQPMGTEICLLYGPQDTAFAYDDFKAFNGMRVGYEEGSTLLDSFQAFAGESGFMFTPVPYKTDPDATKAMDAGKVDAVIETSFLRPTGGNKILARCGLGLVYIAASKAKPGLKAELDNAMMQLMSVYPDFNATIHDYYFKTNSKQVIGYTAEEKEYLASKPVVTVYYEENWEPFEYEENGAASGITPDLLRAVGKETGITFHFEKTPSTQNQYVSIGSTTEDAAMAVSYDYLWADDHRLMMTQPYVTGSVMQVTKAGGISPATVAVVKDTYLEKVVSDYYPELEQVKYLTTGECMEAVSSGKADCTFINSYQATDYRAKSSYSELSYQPAEGLTQGIALGAADTSDQRLISILSKAVYSISDDALPDILSRDSVRSERATLSVLLKRYPVQSAAALAFICAAVTVIIFLFITSLQRKKQNLLLAAAKLEAEAARQLADEANAAKSDFLSRMSHDIRTPLNGIIGMTYLTQKMELPEKARENLQKIDTSSKFLLSLINNVLDMTKAESGKIELHPEPYPIDELNKYIDAVVRPLCLEKGLKFVLDEGLTIFDVVPVADKLRCNQIIFNLLSNAVKYTPEGGTITYRISGRLLESGKMQIEHEIKDTGIGMSEKFQKVLFEPFMQENREYVSEKRGTGLGLAIVKKLVDQMGGSITVQSSQDKGTTFRVTLRFDTVPAASLDSDSLQGSTRAENQMILLAGKHVLLCEDHPMNQEIAKAILEEKHMLVTVADEGEAGVKAFNRSNIGYYDCILMDIHMPVMDGYEATKAIRSLKRADAKSVPIIAMTADAFSDDVQKCIEIEMNGHIAKPIDPKLLIWKLSEVLAEKMS